MSDLESILGLAGVPLMEKELAEWSPTPEQEKWLGGANRQDPYILWRMPGKKPPISYFKDPSDQELAKAIGYVENPAPVVDRNPPETATTQARPDDKNKSEPMPLDKPAVTRAATDTRSSGNAEPLAAEPTKSDNDDVRANMAQDDEPLDIDSMKIDPDADGEDMNFNPDMTSVQAPKAEPGELKPADRVLDPEDEAELAAKYDADLAADDETNAFANYADDESGTGASYMARADGDSAYGPYDSYDAMMKARANPAASADADRGTSVNKMRDTMNKMSQADTIKDLDKQFDADEYDNPQTRLGGTDAQRAEVSDLEDFMFSANNPQKEQPASVKDTLTKALAQEPKVDMDKPMPSNIRSGQDLYKALDGNLNWLDKNIK